MGFVNTQKIVSFKSFSSEIYFWRENLDEISPGQIGYCAMIECPKYDWHVAFGPKVLCYRRAIAGIFNAPSTIPDVFYYE